MKQQKGNKKGSIYNANEDEAKAEISEVKGNYNLHKDVIRMITKQDLDNLPFRLKPKQEECISTIRNNILTIVEGPAGTSKTFTFCLTALKLLVDGKIDKIVLTKPIQESGENLGFLPGTVGEKMEPYIQSYKSNFLKIINKGQYDFLERNGIIRYEALAFMRGSSYDNCIMCLDEAQNCTDKQLMLWLTRIGNNSKAVLMGDISQYDIKKQDVKMDIFIEKVINGLQGSAIFKFGKEDIVRNKFLIDLVDNYEKYKVEQDAKTKPNNRNNN